MKNILRIPLAMLVLLMGFGFQSVGASTFYGPATLAHVQLSSGSPSLVKVLFAADPPEPAACTDGEIHFTYAEGTASELYYAMLMTALGAGLPVRVGYQGSGALCALDFVEVYPE